MEKEFIDTLEKIGKAWQLPVVQQFVSNIKKKKLISSSKLLNSLDSSTTANISSSLVLISFAFEEYGRYQDMKKRKWGSAPPIEEIIDWVKKEGINKFKDPNPRPGKTTERRLNEIAWGISKSKKWRQGVKGKPWFQSTFYKQLQALQEELLLGAADRTIEHIKDSLTSRLK